MNNFVIKFSFSLFLTLALCFGTAVGVTVGSIVEANAKTKKIKIKNSCTGYELKMKSCFIQNHTYNLKFSKDKIIINNSIWRDIKNIPLIGEKTDWEALYYKKIKKRKLIVFKIWTEPADIGIQSLIWSVYELKGAKIDFSFRETIRKRKVGAKRPIYDPMVKHKIFTDKKGHAFYSIDGRKKKF